MHLHLVMLDLHTVKRIFLCRPTVYNNQEPHAEGVSEGLSDNSILGYLPLFFSSLGFVNNDFYRVRI